MSPREHARLARDLISACGGLDESANACRVSKGVLSSYQNVHRPECSMPADVIADLERYCGKPIYSAFLKRQVGLSAEPGCLHELSCLFTEEGAGFQGYIRRALANGYLCAREINEARRELAEAEAVLIRCRASLDAAESALP